MAVFRVAKEYHNRPKAEVVWSGSDEAQALQVANSSAIATSGLYRVYKAGAQASVHTACGSPACTAHFHPEPMP